MIGWNTEIAVEGKCQKGGGEMVFAEREAVCRYFWVRRLDLEMCHVCGLADALRMRSGGNPNEGSD
jgi:hypothetical protein